MQLYGRVKIYTLSYFSFYYLIKVLCVRIARRARTHPCVIVYFMSLFYFQLENVMVWLINHLEMFAGAHVRSHSHTQVWGFIFIFFQVPSTSYILSVDCHKPIIKTKCYRARRCKSEELLYLIADYKNTFLFGVHFDIIGFQTENLFSPSFMWKKLNGAIG